MRSKTERTSVMDLARAALKEKTVLLELVFSNSYLQILRLSIKFLYGKFYRNSKKLRLIKSKFSFF